MVRRCLALMLLLGIVSVGALSMTSPSWAATLVEQNVETRVALALRVPQAEAQSWLPAPWQVNPFASGPSKDANFLLVFRDRALVMDAEGKAVAGGSERGVVLLIPAKHAETGETSLYIVRVYTANPQFTDAYKNGVLATVRWEQSLSVSDLDPGMGAEAWEVRNKVGGIIDLRVHYRRAIPNQSKSEFKMHGGPDPNYFRIYRIDQGADVVKSIPVGVDHVQSYHLRVTIAELHKLFDGSEQLVSITVLPWYMRQVFLP